MKAKKLIASILVGMAVVGFTGGCGTQQQEQQTQQTQQQDDYKSKAYVLKHLENGDYKVGDVIRVQKLEMYSEDYQNFEDGVFMFHEVTHTKDNGTLIVRFELTCNHANCVKDTLDDLHKKGEKLQYEDIGQLAFKVTDIKVKDYAPHKDIVVYGEI